MPRKRAYLIYPFAIHGTPLVERFKADLREKYDLVDPYDEVGVGTDPSIAERDIQLLRECDTVIAFLPVEGIQSGLELSLALNLGKKITIYINPNLIGPFITWLREKHGVEVIPWR